jgi:leucyl aminopeptidase (aminopeptidase T)
MNTKWTIAFIIFFTSFCYVANSQPVKDKGKPVDLEELANKIVNQSANIQEGEFVLIKGSVRDLELLENIFVNVRKKGAFPLLTIGSDRLTRKIFTEVPVNYDSQVPAHDLKVFDFVTTIIDVDYSEIFGLLADIPPERFINRGKANEPVSELIKTRKIKGVTLGNGLYPVEALAKQYGITKKELSDIFWKGINVDYTKLEATGKSVKAIFSAGKEVHITNENGTDLKVGIENRKVLVSDGVLTNEDIQEGYASSQVYLPAGEVYMSTVPGTAEGKVVVDRLFYQDKEILGLTLTFKAGKLISMTAKSGIEPFKKIYDLAEAGKEELSAIDIGINPNIPQKPLIKLGAWMPAGMITIGVGNNIWAGGENKIPFVAYFFLPGSTLKIDEKVVVKEGKLMLD